MLFKRVKLVDADRVIDAFFVDNTAFVQNFTMTKGAPVRQTWRQNPKNRSLIR